MSSRDTVLKAIRKSQREATPLLTLDQDWLTFDDQIDQFTKVLEFGRWEMSSGKFTLGNQ